MNLKSSKEWKEFLKLNQIEINIPATADRVYVNSGWKSWGDFLGYEDRSREIVSFYKAKKIVSKLNINNIKEWRLYTKSDYFDHSLPKDPHSYYKNKGWKGFKDFIGK